jgi:hypothetical protein
VEATPFHMKIEIIINRAMCFEPLRFWIGVEWRILFISCYVMDVDHQRKMCEPGKLFKEDCNLCRCSNDGKYSACTKHRCPLKPLSLEGM